MPWVPIILCVPLLLTEVAVLFQVSCCHSLECLCIVSVSHSGGFALFVVHHIFSLGWLHDIWGILWLFPEVVSVISEVLLSLTKITLCCRRCPTSAYWCDSVTPGIPLSHTSVAPHYLGISQLLMRWLSINSDIPPSLTGVAACHICGFKVAHHSGSMA